MIPIGSANSFARTQAHFLSDALELAGLLNSRGAFSSVTSQPHRPSAFGAGSRVSDERLVGQDPVEELTKQTIICT